MHFVNSEVWLDTNSKLIWGDTFSQLSDGSCMGGDESRMANGNLKNIAFQIPSLSQYQQAKADGLRQAIQAEAGAYSSLQDAEHAIYLMTSTRIPGSEELNFVFNSYGDGSGEDTIDHYYVGDLPPGFSFDYYKSWESPMHEHLLYRCVGVSGL